MPTRLRRWRCFCILVVQVVTLLHSLCCQAQTFTTVSGPNAPALKISLSKAPDTNSSFTELSLLSVSVKPGATSTVDRELDIVLYIGGQYQDCLAYHATLTIPAGQSAATGKIKYLRSDSTVQWGMDILEGGQNILSTPPTTQIVSNNVNPAFLTWLILHHESDSRPNIIPEVSETDDSNSMGMPAKQLGMLVTRQQPLDDASTDWRLYLSYDAICIRAERLSQIKSESLEAISNYVLAGGTLIIHGVDGLDLATIDQSLSPHVSGLPVDPRWKGLTRSMKKIGSQRTHGGGQILAVSNVDQSLSEHLHNTYGHPMSGVTLDDDEDYRWFWRNLVQSVGKPPIVFFIVMIIAMVLIMGPGLILFTHRRRHRTLLLFLIPLFSILVSCFLLIVSVLREGFRTTGRIVSVQFYDSTSNSGFVWSRQSYFSGAPPKNGLVFSGKALIRPISVSDTFFPVMESRHKVTGHIYNESDSQTLKYWLSPRSQQQICVAHPVRDFQIPFAIERVNDTSIRVSNRSNHTLDLVVIRGKGDQYFVCESLEPHLSEQAESKSIDDLLQPIMRWARDYSPSAPLDIDLTRRTNPYYYLGGQSLNHVDGIDTLINRKFGIQDFPEAGYLIVSRHELSAETPFPKEVFLKEENTHFLLGVHPW